MTTIKAAKERLNAISKELGQNVAAIIEDVRENTDKALLQYNVKFDQCTRRNLRLERKEIERAYSEISQTELEDLKGAAHHIRAFAQAQKDSMSDLPEFSPAPGIVLGHRRIPVDSCCCYVPGGGYPLYSSAMMLAIPAKVAGVKRIAACSPVIKGSSNIHPKTVVAMDIAGVDEIYAVGGAHAVAAFAYGTEQIAPVDLIVGPGNKYVTEAKRQCYGQVGIDFVAGPSEILIIADDSANPEIIAADLLAQCEHDYVAQGVIVALSKALAQAVITAVEKQLENLETSGIASASWSDYGEVLVADSLEEAVDFANMRAPEHLEIQLQDDDSVAEKLVNYGSLFMGQYTAEVFGDYASGTNHTLPTMRAARYTGGVWVGTFLKTCTHQRLTRDAMLEMAPLVSRLARGEGLMGHARAAEIRVEKL